MKLFKKNSMTFEESFALQRQANGFMAVWDAAAKGKSAEEINSKYKGAEYMAFHEELMTKDSVYKDNFESYRELAKDETFKEMDGAITKMTETGSVIDLCKAFGQIACHPVTFNQATKHLQKAVDIFAENYKADKPDAPKM